MEWKAGCDGQKAKPMRGDGTGSRNIPGSTEVLHLEAAGETAMEVADRHMPLVSRAGMLRKCRLSRRGHGNQVRVSDFKPDPGHQVDSDKHKDADMEESGLHARLSVNIAFARRLGKSPRGP